MSPADGDWVDDLAHCITTPRRAGCRLPPAARLLLDEPAQASPRERWHSQPPPPPPCASARRWMPSLPSPSPWTQPPPPLQTSSLPLTTLPGSLDPSPDIGLSKLMSCWLKQQPDSPTSQPTSPKSVCDLSEPQG
eukprot:1151472-Prymnesium_polylepis.1